MSQDALESLVLTIGREGWVPERHQWAGPITGVEHKPFQILQHAHSVAEKGAQFRLRSQCDAGDASAASTTAA